MLSTETHEFVALVIVRIIQYFLLNLFWQLGVLLIDVFEVIFFDDADVAVCGRLGGVDRVAVE